MGALGVIGGMGPAASAYFYRLLTDMTDAQTDQGHLEAVIYSLPQIPDRTAYITGGGEDPLPALISAANALAAFGVENIAIPCVTAHHFYDGLAAATTVPVVNMLDETLSRLKEAGVKRAGLLCTDGTITSGRLRRTLEDGGVSVMLPPPDGQSAIMRTIYNCKATGAIDNQTVGQVADDLTAAGAEIILLGCTELSLVEHRDNYFDMLRALARRCIYLSGGRVRNDG